MVSRGRRFVAARLAIAFEKSARRRRSGPGALIGSFIMSARVSLFIRLGGDLLACIQNEGLARDYDADAFTADDIPSDAPLSLYAHEVAWGRVDLLEGFCASHGLSYVRWSGGCAAQFGPERAVFNGAGEVRLFAADEDDRLVIDIDRVERLGSYEAIMAYFAAGDMSVLPLRFLA
ncbi:MULTISPECIES: hypothetical protein [Sphingobium]|jgi:hypothetical protein|uniref:Uncharacterized protein n=3 Tax=Sphingomonadaceae TaxID=41297 RepID=A0AA43B9U2_SPHYA|nr:MULTISPECIES: hypothetical protein [Sphingobium]MCC4258836.1 hypothetical protein [Sphingobium lactosutens]MDH2133801.1 hypothetical protein [Sphingobium yanoikuyae]